MSPGLLPAVIFLAITSTALGDRRGSRTANFARAPEIRDLDNALFSTSVRNGTSAIHVVIASQEENPFLDIAIEMYSNFAPLVVQKLGGKYRLRSSGPGLRINNVDFVLSFYDTTAQINLEELESTFASTWSPRARILLWVWRATGRSIDEIFGDFWSRGVLNVDLIVQDFSGGGWEVFTYNPFVIGDKARGSVERLIPNAKELFPNKLSDLHNYSISISVFDQFPTTIMTEDFKQLNTGPDTEFLRIISKEMNFHVDLKTANANSVSYATTLKNNERTGVLGDIINGRSEAVWNRQYMDNLPVEFVEFTYPRYTVRTRVIVRKADQVPMTIRAVLPFPGVIWSAVLTVTGVLVILMTFAKEKEVFPRVVRLLLFQNLGKIPARNFTRVYSVSWIFWSLLMGVIYQANFARDLMFPKYYKDVDSPQDLYDRNMTLFVGYNMLTLVNNSEIDAWRRLADRTELELNFDHCVDRVIGREPVACATREYIASFMPMEKRFRDENGPKLYKMKERLSDHWEAFMVRRGSPYLDMFDKFIARLMEGGIYHKWLRPILVWHIMHEPKYDDTILTMKHFKGVFLVLFIGMSISAVIFILETILPRVSRGWTRLFGIGRRD